MSKRALFPGLVFDEFNQPVSIVFIGDDPCYVINDAGFKRHIPAEYVDRQVLEAMRDLIQGHEGLISEQAAKMIGQDDIFSIAMIENQLKQIDEQFNSLLDTGIPEEARAYMGMIGFKIIIDFHGDVIEIQQPSSAISDDDSSGE